MKRLIYALLLVLLLSGCGLQKVIPSGEVIETSYELSDFSSVQVENDFNVVITEGEEYSVAVTTHENLFDHFDIEVVGDVLQIKYIEGTVIKNPQIDVVVTLNNLEGVYAYNDSVVDFGDVKNVLSNFTISGNNDSLIKGDISAISVVIDIHNDASIDIDMYSTKLKLDAYNNSLVEIEGLTTNITLEAHDDSLVDLTDLPAGVVDVTMHNDANVKLKNVLEVNATLYNEAVLECRQVITINEMFLEETATIEEY